MFKELDFGCSKKGLKSKSRGILNLKEVQKGAILQRFQIINGTKNIIVANAIFVLFWHLNVIRGVGDCFECKKRVFKQCFLFKNEYK